MTHQQHVERDICNRLLAFFHTPDQVEDWLTTTQYVVGLSPQQLIDIGMVDDVLGLVRSLESTHAPNGTTKWNWFRG